METATKYIVNTKFTALMFFKTHQVELLLLPSFISSLYMQYMVHLGGAPNEHTVAAFYSGSIQVSETHLFVLHEINRAFIQMTDN